MLRPDHDVAVRPEVPDDKSEHRDAASENYGVLLEGNDAGRREPCVEPRQRRENDDGENVHLAFPARNNIDGNDRGTPGRTRRRYGRNADERSLRNSSGRTDSGRGPTLTPQVVLAVHQQHLGGSGGGRHRSSGWRRGRGAGDLRGLGSRESEDSVDVRLDIRRNGRVRERGGKLYLQLLEEDDERVNRGGFRLNGGEGC